MPRALGLIDNIDLGVAAVGAALGGLTLVLLRLHARRLRAAGAATPPFVTLQVLCGAALLFNGATLLHAAAGGCEGAGAATGAVVRFAAGLSTYTFRGGAALLALLMAHASCPERSMRARAEWVARAYRRGAAALAVVLVGSELTELVVSLVDAAAAGGGGGGDGGGNLTLAAAATTTLVNPGPAAPTAGEPFCGGSTPAIKWFHLAFEAATTIVTTIALGLIRLAPLRGPHPAELPAAQLNAVTPTTAEVLTAGDDEEQEAAAPRVPPQPATTTALVQPLLAELPASLPATAAAGGGAAAAAAAVRGRLPRRAGARVRGAPSVEDASLPPPPLRCALEPGVALRAGRLGDARRPLERRAARGAAPRADAPLRARHRPLRALRHGARARQPAVGVVHARRAARLPSHLEHARARVSVPYSVL